MKILIAEDEEISRKHLIYALADEGYNAKAVANGLAALDEIERHHWDVLITDIKMPGMDGLTLFRRLRKEHPEIDVIIVTGFGTIAQAIDAIRNGAEDYVTKPFNIDDIVVRLKKIEEHRKIERDNEALRKSAGLTSSIPFIAKSKKMQDVIGLIDKLKDSDCNVMINGPTGTGKGMVAKLIHYSGARRERPFIGINCAVFTEELLASELFGHEKGAFTGAVSMKKGLMELAHTGTLFLDEIAEMPANLQARFLKVIEEGEFFRVGGTRQLKTDVRVLAATNRDIKTLVSTGGFREDLYYRLNVMEIAIPPLTERRDDVMALCHFFLDKYRAKYGKTINGIADSAEEILMEYNFPGNVRELENMMERAIIIEATDKITRASLPQGLLMLQFETLNPERVKTIDELTRGYVKSVVELFHGNRTLASDALGISRTSLWRILKDETVSD